MMRCAGLSAAVCGAFSLFVGAASSLADTPKGLSDNDWSSIRAAYEANRHAAVVGDGGYEACNPGQQWRTRFDGRGFTVTPSAADCAGESPAWSWGLELVSFGRVGAERAVTTPLCVDADGRRVAYEWSDALTEWYINGARGLEHGYTVHARPDAGSGPLSLELAVRGELCPRVSENGRDVAFVREGGAAALTYNDLTVFDAGGAAVPAWFEAIGDGLSLRVDDRDARYPLTIDPIAQQAYLKASNTGAFDYFGISVAVSGDTVVVGAYAEESGSTGVNGNQADNGAPDSGAVYVFVRSGGIWTEQAYLKASNTGASDFFGYSVAIGGDTVVVGAYQEDSGSTGVNGNQADNSATDSGAAYVFVRSSGVWSQQAYLKASNTGAGDKFGRSVAISGDTVVVGAFQEDSASTGVNGNQTDNTAADSGAAYVFVRAGGVWSQHAYLKASNTSAVDSFGISVAVSGNTVLVGAYQEDSNATGVNGNQADNSAGDSGAAYVFVRSGGVWSQQAYLKASNTGVGDWFGWSVSISGDTAVVGAINESSSATGVNGNQSDNSDGSSGAAYIFLRSAGVWSQQAYLKASNTNANDQFGVSVAISGDTVVVGATTEDGSATGVNGNEADNSVSASGAAYVLVRAGGVWSQQAYLKASNTGSDDRFGSSVAVSGDTVVIGAYREDCNATGVNGNEADNSAPDSGAAYIFIGVPRPRCPADLNNDSQVNLTDLSQLLGAFGTASGDLNYRAAADIDSDGYVNLSDLALLLANFGSSCPT